MKITRTINNVIFTQKSQKNNHSPQNVVVCVEDKPDVFVCKKNEITPVDIINALFTEKKIVPHVYKPLAPSEINSPDVVLSREFYNGVPVMVFTQVGSHGEKINKTYYRESRNLSKENILAYEIFHKNGNLKQQVEVDIFSSDAKFFEINDYNKDGKRIYERRVILRGGYEDDVVNLFSVNPETNQHIKRIL